MTDTNRNEIIAAISKVLERFVEDEPIQVTEPALPPDTVEMLTIKECTEAVKGLNEFTVRQLVARNEIPYVRYGEGKRGKILIPKSALIEYVSGKSHSINN